jgi:pyruvate carboxylase
MKLKYIVLKPVSFTGRNGLCKWYSGSDGLSLIQDESYLIGKDMAPVQAYLSIDEYIRIAKVNGLCQPTDSRPECKFSTISKDNNVDAIHPGYGFLSESGDFSKACYENDIIFLGPTPDVMYKLVCLANFVAQMARFLSIKVFP